MIKFVFFLYFYLKGVLRFRAKDFPDAYRYFTKAKKYKNVLSNELFCQYYGQTLLSLNKIEEAFDYLSMAYNIYKVKGWDVDSDEEKILIENTIKALRCLDVHYNLRIENDEHKASEKVKKLRLSRTV